MPSACVDAIPTLVAVCAMDSTRTVGDCMDYFCHRPSNSPVGRQIAVTWADRESGWQKRAASEQD